jgi:hypothetical protein
MKKDKSQSKNESNPEKDGKPQADNKVSPIKNKLLTAFILAIIVVAVFAVPALAQNADVEYVSVENRQSFILIYSAVTVIATAAVYFISGARRGEDAGLWRTAISFSLLCLVGIGVLWYMVEGSSPDENYEEYYHLMDTVQAGAQCEKLDLQAVAFAPSPENPIHVRMLDSSRDVQCMKDEQIKLALAPNAEQPVFIETGAFIQSLEFTSANNVVVTGYVWQKYPADTPDYVEHGFILPEGDEEIYYVEDDASYRKEQDGELLLGWYIHTSLRQTFDYSKYPFDRQDIWLRFWHLNFDRNVILTPDFESYGITEWPHKQTTYLGLERDFVLERLALERTYFNYHYNNYNTDFGIANYQGQSAFPELYFNVGVKREVLDAVVAYLIPMFILLLMSFGVQFIVTQIPEKMSMHGISTTGLIAYYASLFFIGILAHLDIRRTLNAAGVVYIEYFYFALYVILLLQTVNSIIFAATDDVGFLEYKDNLIPKVIFFPVTLGLMYAVTAYIFY